MNQDNAQLRDQLGRLGSGGTGVGNLYRAISDEQAAATLGRVHPFHESGQGPGAVTYNQGHEGSGGL